MQAALHAGWRGLPGRRAFTASLCSHHLPPAAETYTHAEDFFFRLGAHGQQDGQRGPCCGGSNSSSSGRVVPAAAGSAGAYNVKLILSDIISLPCCPSPCGTSCPYIAVPYVQDHPPRGSSRPSTCCPCEGDRPASTRMRRPHVPSPAGPSTWAPTAGPLWPWTACGRPGRRRRRGAGTWRRRGRCRRRASRPTWVCGQWGPAGVVSSLA